MKRLKRSDLVTALRLDMLVWPSLVLVISPQAMAVLRRTEMHP